MATKKSAGLKRAEQMAKSADKNYSSLKRAVLKSVVRWEWVTFHRHDPDPAYFATHKFARGKRLAKKPTKIDHQFEEGFDDQGRLVAVKGTIYDTKNHYETFYLYLDGSIERYHYGPMPPKQCINVAVYTLQDGRITAIDSVYEGSGHRSLVYTFDKAGKLTGLVGTGKDEDGDDQAHRMDIDVNDAGDIIRTWWCHAAGGRAVYWEKPSKTETLKTKRKVILDGLRDAVIASIAKLKVKEPIGAVCVHWTSADYKERLPPLVGVALASEKVKAGDTPEEWKHWSLSLVLDSDLKDTCRRVNHDIHLNNREAAADKLMKELAAALGRAKIPAKKTRDFVSYPLRSLD